MKAKTLLELLKKHGVHIYDNDEALISEVETEYKNQFSQLPASVTDKDIERMTEAEFPTTNSIYDRVQEKRIVYAKGLKDMRSLLNHPPVIGEGEKESKYHFAREVIFTLRSCQAISIDVYLHWIEKLNKDENSPPPPHQAKT